MRVEPDAYPGSTGSLRAVIASIRREKPKDLRLFKV
jgi:hypothetical protein